MPHGCTSVEKQLCACTPTASTRLYTFGPHHVAHHYKLPWGGLNSLVSSVASIEPDSIEAEGEELPNDGPQSTPSSQQQLDECPGVDCLQHDSLCN